jgi:hypothetical protein
MSEYSLPIYESLPLGHSETPRHVHDLIRDSEQHSVTNHITYIILYRHRTLSVRTLRVREWCRHDRDDYPVNNQQRTLDAHIGSYIFHEDLYWLNLIWQHTLFPLSGGMLLARDSIVGISIPSSISLPASLFTHSVIRHLATNSLVMVLARLLWCCIIERAQRYLSDSWKDKSQSWSMPTQQTLSEIPVVHLYNHPVTLWRLIHPKYSYGIQELHDFMVGGTCIWHSESSSNKLNDHMLR